MKGSFFYIGNRALKNNIILWQEDKVYSAMSIVPEYDKNNLHFIARC
mgnify:CR=1 FL=1